MTGMKRKSEDIHASFAKNDLPQIPKRGGEAAVDVDVEGGKIMPFITTTEKKTTEEENATPTKRRKSKQSTDFFNELPSLMGLETLPTISRQNSFSIYNNGGDITRVLSSNNLFAAEEDVPPASLGAVPPLRSVLKEEEEEEEGNAIYNADNIVNTTHANNEVANTSNAANANNTLWESLDLPMPPMHPTPMTNNNYSAHEQEIILGSKSFTLGTPYATQNELMRMNVNKNDKNNTKNTGNKKAKVTAGKNAAGGKQAPSKAQQQKNRRQTVKAKKDAILAVDKIMADNAKNLSPPRNLLNNDARLRTTEVQEANGQYQYFHAQQEQTMQKRNERMTTMATLTTPSDEENANPPSNGSREDENNKKSDNNNRSSDNSSNETSLVKEVGNSADGATNNDDKNNKKNKSIQQQQQQHHHHQQQQRNSQAELMLLEEFQTVVRNLYSVTRENIKNSLYRLAEEAKNRAAGATILKQKDHVMVDQSVVNLLYQRY